MEVSCRFCLYWFLLVNRRHAANASCFSISHYHHRTREHPYKIWNPCYPSRVRWFLSRSPFTCCFCHQEPVLQWTCLTTRQADVLCQTRGQRRSGLLLAVPSTLAPICLWARGGQRRITEVGATSSESAPTVCAPPHTIGVGFRMRVAIRPEPS